MKNIAVILAGGKGSRMGIDRPKQFVALADGRTVLETCVDAFHQNGHIDEIAIVMLKDYMAEAQAILPSDRFPKVRYWIAGGSERYESSLNAIETIKTSDVSDCNLFIHDCARPFISQNLITRVSEALRCFKAVSVAVPVTDTLYLTRPTPQGEAIQEIPPRQLFRRAQTPQAFRLSLLAEAYAKALSEPRDTSLPLNRGSRRGSSFTDDASVVLTTMPGENIYLIPGEETNRKLTFREDFL